MGQKKIFVNLVEGLVLEALPGKNEMDIKCVDGAHEIELLEFNHVRVDGVIYKLEDYGRGLYLLVEVIE